MGFCPVTFADQLVLRTCMAFGRQYVPWPGVTDAWLSDAFATGWLDPAKLAVPTLACALLHADPRTAVGTALEQERASRKLSIGQWQAAVSGCCRPDFNDLARQAAMFRNDPARRRAPYSMVSAAAQPGLTEFLSRTLCCRLVDANNAAVCFVNQTFHDWPGDERPSFFSALYRNAVQQFAGDFSNQRLEDISPRMIGPDWIDDLESLELEFWERVASYEPRLNVLERLVIGMTVCGGLTNGEIADVFHRAEKPVSPADVDRWLGRAWSKIFAGRP